MTAGGLRFRRAKPEDTAEMLRITRNVWEGTDYLPHIWNDWLHDSSGYLMVGQVDGRVVGLQHIAVQDDGTAWLEGIRVAEEAQGTGLGQGLLEQGLEWAQTMGCTFARLSTASSNPASNRLAEKGGMRPVATFASLRAEARAGGDPPDGVKLATPMDVDRVHAHLEQCLPGGFYTEGWTAYRLTRDRVRRLCGTKSVALVEGAGAIAGVLIATCTNPFRVIRVGAMTGDTETVVRLAQFALAQARTLMLPRLRATVSLHQERLHALGGVGFESARDFSMVLHEKHLG